MACEFARSGCRLMMVGTALAVFFSAMTGCRPQAEITQYSAPKEKLLAARTPKSADASDAAATEPVAADAAAADATNGAAGGDQLAAADAAAPDRMLAAIIVRGQAAWSFKMTGPAAVIEKQAEAFEALVKSVTFPAAAQGKPQWKLPEGWKERLDGAMMRYATLTSPGEPPLELTVASFTWPGGGDTQNLLANVNRWRGQMQLPPIAAGDLEKETRKLKAGDAEAIVVDLKGKFSGGMPPFAGGAKGKGPMPADRPPPKDAKKSDGGKSDEKKSDGGKSEDAKSPPPKSSAKTEQPADAKLPFTYNVPDAWKPTDTLPMFAVAGFTVKNNPAQADVTITQLPLIPGGVLANVNRWRQQLGLPPVGADDLDAVAKPIDVGGKPGHRVELFAPESANPRRAIVAVLVNDSDGIWFVTLKSDVAEAQRQRENFQQFTDSLKFR